jgi:hypothetical protein
MRVVSSASARIMSGRMVVRKRTGWSGIELILIQAGEQLEAGFAIEQTRDRKAVAGLEGADRGLRLGCIQAIDRSRVIPEVAQMSLRDLDLTLVQDPVERRA